MTNVNLWLRPCDFRMVAFYPYTSATSNRLLEQNMNYRTECHDFLENFGQEVRKMVEQQNILWDNKVVVELEYCPTDLRQDIGFKASHIFVGCYDGLWSIGLAMWQDPWLEKCGANKYFSYSLNITPK